jgi:hypothetical protein
MREGYCRQRCEIAHKASTVYDRYTRTKKHIRHVRLREARPEYTYRWLGDGEQEEDTKAKVYIQEEGIQKTRDIYKRRAHIHTNGSRGRQTKIRPILSPEKRPLRQEFGSV